MNPFKIVDDFENAVASYTGAPYCVAVNSCTNALFLCLMWEVEKAARVFAASGGIYAAKELPESIEIPKHTYIGVAQSILNADFNVSFRDESWNGSYRLKPFDLFDAAKMFTSNMYIRHIDDKINYSGEPIFVCTSHHWTKILGIQQGGCILHNDMEANIWLRKARFDGRTPRLPASRETQPIRGWHMYMSPEIAAEGLVRLAGLPLDNPPQPMDNYPDLSKMDIFQ